MKVDLEHLESLKAHAQAADTGDKYLATWAYESALVENASAMLAELKKLRSQVMLFKSYAHEAGSWLEALKEGELPDREWLHIVSFLTDFHIDYDHSEEKN